VISYIVTSLSGVNLPGRPGPPRRHSMTNAASVANSPTLPSHSVAASTFRHAIVQGYLGDIGVPPDPAPIDFSAWFEAFVGGRWWTFDARHNVPRIGRVLMARGRDAADVAIGTTAGHDYGNGITGGIGPVAPGLGWVEICRSGTSATSSSSLTNALLTRPPRRSCGLCLTGKYQR
jgi:hypothetical protein